MDPWLPVATLAVHTPSYPSYDGGEDKLRISQSLWALLQSSIPSNKGNDHTDDKTILVSVAFATDSTTPLFSAYGCLDPSLSHQDNQHCVSVPNRLALKYSLVGSSSSSFPSSIIISRTRPVVLSHVVLFSHNKQAYDFSQSHQNQFQQLVSSNKNRIVRQGDDDYCIHDDHSQSSSKIIYKVLLCEPVMQGTVSSTTRFVVLPPRNTSSTIKSIINSEELHDPIEKQPDDAFDIDETFLAQSFVQHIHPDWQQPALSTTTPPVSTDQLQKSPTQRQRQSSNQPNANILFSLCPLKHPIHPHVLLPRPSPSEDEHLHAFLPASVLARCGLCSGDWTMLIRSSDRRPLNTLFRIFALPDNVSVSKSFDNNKNINSINPTIYIPPDTTISSNNNLDWSSTVSLRRLSQPPCFPTASSLNLARISSPHSLQKQYQSLFLASLRTYFQSRQRIVRLGDVISIPISQDMARWAHDESDGPIVQLPYTQQNDNNTVPIFFKITTLQHNNKNINGNVNSSGKTSDWNEEQEEIDDFISSGFFGTIVDPSSTQMMQTGLEHSKTPCAIADYFGLSSSSVYNHDYPPLVTLVNYLNAPLSSPSTEAVMRDVYLSILVKGAKGSGKRSLIASAAHATSVHVLEVDVFSLISETDVKSEGQLRAMFDRAISCTPCILLLRNIDALARKSQIVETGQEPPLTFALQDCLEQSKNAFSTTGYPCFVMATTSNPDKISPGIIGAFKQEISLDAPSESTRLDILRSLTKNDSLSPDVSLRSVAIQTAALVLGDLVDLIIRTRMTALRRVIEQQKQEQEQAESYETISIADMYRAGVSLTSIDFNEALEKARSSYSESIGAPKIPNVTWDDVGGLANVKADILDTIQLPLERPELFADGLKKRSGILLYGPPGTGKTLLAKAVATSCSLNFFSVKGPELLNMYIGESEANVRRVFQKARDAKPCVIFFDELDSVAPKRGNQGDSGGVMDRIVSQLLAELDGMAEGQDGADVFVIGATNRPDLLDPALLRPGRFDRMLYLGVSDTHSAQEKILEALTRKFKCEANVDFEALSKMCPFNFTGADFYALCSDAMLKAMTRKAEEVDKRVAEYNKAHPSKVPITPQYYLGEIANAEEIQVLVSQQDFIQSLNELVPSVSSAEMEHYAIVQKRFSSESSKETRKREASSAEKSANLTNGVDLKPRKIDKGKGRAIEQ